LHSKFLGDGGGVSGGAFHLQPAKPLPAAGQSAAGVPQPATLRAAVLVCGAILGRSGRQLVLHLSASWGGLIKHKPLLDAVLGWRKLDFAEVDPSGRPSRLCSMQNLIAPAPST